MRDDFIGDTPGISPDTRGIERHCAVEPFGDARRRGGSGLAVSRSLGRSSTLRSSRR
jgi:hypothetical protein